MPGQRVEPHVRYPDAHPYLGRVNGALTTRFKQQQGFDQAQAIQKQAVHHYDKVLKLDSESPGTHNDAEIALASQRFLDLAEGYFQKSIKLDPANDQAYNNLGNAYMIRKDFEQAADLYGQAPRLNPYNEGAQASLEIARKELQQGPSH